MYSSAARRSARPKLKEFPHAENKPSPRQQVGRRRRLLLPFNGASLARFARAKK
jgi:hypothetical protein